MAVRFPAAAHVVTVLGSTLIRAATSPGVMRSGMPMPALWCTGGAFAALRHPADRALDPAAFAITRVTLIALGRACAGWRCCAGPAAAPAKRPAMRHPPQHRHRRYPGQWLCPRLPAQGG